MTAIAGYWAYDSRPDPSRPCERMLVAQAEYGPDGMASGSIGGLCLGRRLYRLLPEDVHDRQPLIDPDRQSALVADVRLDNRAELSAALGLGGSTAGVLADSELLFLALQRWGEAAVDHLIGDYAFAFFDASRQRLILARDPLGQRPLFWHRGASFLAFSSMPKGLHALGRIPKRPDAERLARFIGLLPHSGPGSYHAQINRVEPGHIAIFSPSDSRSQRYWSPRRRTLRLRRFEDYVEAYRAELDRAVACRLRGAKGTVATHLSGGWDSSAVTSTAARLSAAAGGRLVAFTSVPGRNAEARAPSRRFSDESTLAAQVAAEHENIRHILVEGSGRSPIADLDRYAALFERPLPNLCNHIWLSEIRESARSHGARILLTGEIGNWTISASPNTLLADFVREMRWAAWAREAAAMVGSGRARIRGVAATSFGPWIPDAIWRGFLGLSSSPDVRMNSALHPDRRRRSLAPRPKDRFQDAVEALFDLDWGEYRKGVLGGWGIDKRDATADIRLVEFCLSLPIDMLLKDGVRRPLARAALSDRLPTALLDERGKGYQAADWHVGMTNDRAAIAALIEKIAANALAASLIDVDGLRAWMKDWPEGGWEKPEVVARYRNATLGALSAGHFILAASGD